MPIYEYACAACGHEFEEWQKMSDAPVRTCPKCKKKKVERLISKTAFQLKGSGWYADLYASAKPGQDAAKGEKAESSDSAPTTESAGADKGSSAKGAEKAKPSEGASASKKKAAKKAESRAA